MDQRCSKETGNVKGNGTAANYRPVVEILCRWTSRTRRLAQPFLRARRGFVLGSIKTGAPELLMIKSREEIVLLIERRRSKLINRDAFHPGQGRCISSF
jgi:hypothetical protein